MLVSNSRSIRRFHVCGLLSSRPVCFELFDFLEHALHQISNALRVTAKLNGEVYSDRGVLEKLRTCPDAVGAAEFFTNRFTQALLKNSPHARIDDTLRLVPLKRPIEDDGNLTFGFDALLDRLSITPWA